MKFEPYIEPPQLDPLDKWCRRFAVYAGIPWVFFLFLYGCAAPLPYWTLTHAPVAVKEVRVVDVPCGRYEWLGCSNRTTGVIEIKRGLPEPLRSCVESHERRELAGWSHGPESAFATFATDCGDGTVVPLR